MPAQIIRLDQILRRYGPETAQARELLRQYAELKTVDLFPDNPADVRLSDPSTYELLQRVEDPLLALKPASHPGPMVARTSTTLAVKIGDARWQLAQQVGQGTPKAFLALLVFWLAPATERPSPVVTINVNNTSSRFGGLPISVHCIMSPTVTASDHRRSDRQNKSIS
jgi:hypothetical protein